VRKFDKAKAKKQAHRWFWIVILTMTGVSLLLAFR
jgi:hypothetical protein